MEAKNSPHGLLPSHGRLLCTHWSHACLLVVALVGAVVPFRRPGGPAEEGASAFSAAWHLLMWRKRRSERANWSPQCWHL
jgi:hypothetical protein